MSLRNRTHAGERAHQDAPLQGGGQGPEGVEVLELRIATRRHPVRCAARSFGATDVLALLGDAERGGYGVIAECAGKPGLLDGCVAAARPRGRVVVAGLCLEPTPLTSVAALMKEVSIGFAVYYSPAEFSEVIAAFADGRISPALLVSRWLGLPDLNNAFDDLARTAAGVKTLIRP